MTTRRTQRLCVLALYVISLFAEWGGSSFPDAMSYFDVLAHEGWVLVFAVVPVGCLLVLLRPKVTCLVVAYRVVLVLMAALLSFLVVLAVLYSIEMKELVGPWGLVLFYLAVLCSLGVEFSPRRGPPPARTNPDVFQ